MGKTVHLFRKVFTMYCYPYEHTRKVGECRRRSLFHVHLETGVHSGFRVITGYSYVIILRCLEIVPFIQLFYIVGSASCNEDCFMILYYNKCLSVYYGKQHFPSEDAIALQPYLVGLVNYIIFPKRC